MSPRITFSVGSLVPFRTATFATSGVLHSIPISLEDGDHTFTSAEFPLGTVPVSGGRRLIGHLKFNYSYSAKYCTVTISGTDFPSANGMTLITKLEGLDSEVCVEHAASGTGFAADEGLLNRTWNYRCRLMPGAAEEIKNIVRGANESLIAALIASREVVVVQVRQTLPESLPAADYHNLSVVYRDGKFLEVHNPTREYELHDVVAPVESTYGGDAHWNYGTNFANVLGSTGDPFPPGYNSWIKFWKTSTGDLNPNTCTSLSFGSGQPFQCSNPPTPLGGHVILGQQVNQVIYGSDQVAAIFPICSAHNNNNNVFMAALQYTQGVWLNNYHR
ncbi:hypothetical protein BX600DRAFT_477854 [Xylariales sp. PMI_506]|nr:hypothetical protein BX600DRAFT_477854 [Xylariales sp. PMI_506]